MHNLGVETEAEKRDDVMSSQEQPSTGQAFLKQGTNITGTLPIDFVDHVCAEAGNTLRMLFHLSSSDLIIGRRVVDANIMA